MNAVVPEAHAPGSEPSLSELVELCAVDSELFCRTFFPMTVRQPSPAFHEDIWRLLDSRDRLVNIQVFRGGAKTSILRMYAAKRIAYGLAHTILYIGKSEGHAIRSVKWLRRQVEHNKIYKHVFNLRPGAKWQDIESEIIHGTDEYPIWIMAMGITGSTRGINQDDFRPDLIIADDIIDDENSATPEQRLKIENLVYGALKESLAPASEMPDAKLVMLQTPLNIEDVSCKALKDEEWKSAVFGCWTPATATAPLGQGKSIWPERWSDQELTKSKELSIKRNKLSLFLREKECRLISPETSAFKEDWLKYYELSPEFMHVIMAIDPVPPPSEVQISKGLRGKDYESFAVVGYHQGDYYLLEYSAHRGHEPDWTITEFFRLAYKWRPKRVLVESVAYQRTLSWILKQAMKHQRKYYVIDEWTDKRKKYDRIVDGLSGPASNGHLFVKAEHTEFISQFRSYPNTPNDDILESVAVATSAIAGSYFGDGHDGVGGYGEEVKEINYARGAP